jgi:Protein of unknown function (DUF1573)
MMKKTILLSAITLAFASLCNAQADSKVAPASTTVAPAATATPAVENKNQAEIKFEALEFNFGTIKQGDKVEHTFTFTNAGKEPLIITDARGSCGCTVPVWPKEPIRKGEKGTIAVTFNSAGKMGMQDKTVTITSNGKTNPVVLHVKGNILAAENADAPAVTPAPQGH